ncbi:hypothetical protein ACSBR2_035562 [Camellia fascicularis]
MILTIVAKHCFFSDFSMARSQLSVADCLQQVRTNGRLKSMRHRAKSKLNELQYLVHVIVSNLKQILLSVAATANYLAYCCQLLICSGMLSLYFI